MGEAGIGSVVKLKGYDVVYKIKLRSAGYRLAYEVSDNEIVAYILAIGKHDKILGAVLDN